LSNEVTLWSSELDSGPRGVVPRELTDPCLTSSILLFYGQFMTEIEKLATCHFLGTAKAAQGRTDPAAQQEARNSQMPSLRMMLSSNPEVLSLTIDQAASFNLRTAERICAAHFDEIEVNRCPRCKGVARTPTACQCRFCHHDWHDPSCIRAHLNRSAGD
jgi:hypothetical protein